MATDRTVLVRLKANVGDFVAGMGTAGAAVRGFTHDIDTTNDRVAWLTQGLLAVGPALVPLGAAAVPVLAGIATQATVGAAAIGVLALAFNGIGDALSAVNDYQLEPTAANFEKLQQAMDDIGPAGAEFVMFLDSLGPQLEQLQILAREGLLPGAEEGITDLMTLLPRARGLVSDLATAMGDLMAQAGGDIAGPRFEAFFDFLDRSARPILEDMAKVLGNFAAGFLNLLVGFEPLTMRFSNGLLEMSRGFRSWSEGLGDNATFQQFIGYIEDSIPKALEFGAALAEAFVAIVTAAAPVGDVMLPIFTNVLNVLAAIAETPVGPMFIAAAAAISLYGRAAALLSVTTGGMLKNIIGTNSALGTQVAVVKSLPSAFAEATAAQDALVAAQTRADKLRRTYVTELQTQNRLLAEGYTFLGEEGSRSRAMLTDSLDELELANRDVENATKRSTDAEKQRMVALRGTASAAGKAGALVAGLALITSDYGQQMSLSSTASLALMGAMVGGTPGAVAGGLIGVTMDLHRATGKAAESQQQLSQELRGAGLDMEAQAAAVDAQFERLQGHVDDITSSNIGEVLANAFDPDTIVAFTQDALGKETVEDRMKADADAARQWSLDVQQAAFVVGQSLGMVGEDGAGDLQALQEVMDKAAPAMAALGISAQDLVDAMRDGSIGGLVDQMLAWVSAQDTAAGRTDAVVDAVAALDDQLTTTADSANALATALDNLLSPQLSLIEAQDAWTTSLRSLDKDLAKHGRSLEGNSKASIKNREAVNERVVALKDVLAAQAEAGAGAGKLSTTLRRQVDALVAAGKAANISEDDMRAYLKALGLAPKLIRTLIENNAPDARSKAEGYFAWLRSHEGDTVNTYIRVNRIGGSTSSLGGHTDDDVAGQATGGHIRGPGGPTDDMIPAWLSDNEFVIRAAAVDHYGVDMMHALNAMRFAEGGQATKKKQGDQFTIFTTQSMAHFLAEADNVAQALKLLNHALERSQKAVDKDRAARDAIAGLMADLSSTVQGQLRSDIFATPANPWSNEANLSGTARLNADTALAEEESRLIEALAGKGLTGAALAEVIRGGITRLRAYNTMATSDLAAYSAAFDLREKALQVAGTTAGSAAFGGQLSLADAKLDVTNSRLKDIERAINTMNREQKEAHDKNADKVTSGVNGAAGKGKRKRVYQNGGRG